MTGMVLILGGVALILGLARYARSRPLQLGSVSEAWIAEQRGKAEGDHYR